MIPIFARVPFVIYQYAFILVGYVILLIALTVFTQGAHPILWSARLRNGTRAAEPLAGFSRRLFFLNFDVAITFNRAQHLLALARKVEQGGLNG